MKIYQTFFFSRPTLIVARQLLGAFVVKRAGGREYWGRVVETEAYVGTKDKASHAHKGQTKRNAVMFGPPGYSYVYLVYGMHHLLNIVTGPPGYPAAVLIRACEPAFTERPSPARTYRFGTGGLAAITNAPRLASGPGKVGEYLRLTKKQNGLDVTAGRTLWFEKGYRLAGETIVRRPRIGVDYAQEYKDKLWRFYLKNNPCVSKL